MNYWLMKSEPSTYSIDTLKKDKFTLWDGVRNYQARNFMMKDMKVGDQVLFYHSNTKPPGIAGLATISKTAAPDLTAFDKKSEYFCKKSDEKNPRWFCVEIMYKKKFKNYISLEEIKNIKELKNMMVIRKGLRLSIQPVTQVEYNIICKIGTT